MEEIEGWTLKLEKVNSTPGVGKTIVYWWSK